MAARAGGSGRGFAVVASEVRSLAQRCAAAAREIKGLIFESVERVESGSQVVTSAGAMMDDIVGGSSQVRGLLSEIATGAKEQTQGVDQISSGIADLDRSTQANASLVEETAHSAEALSHQARALLKDVERFQL